MLLQKQFSHYLRVLFLVNKLFLSFHDIEVNVLEIVNQRLGEKEIDILIFISFLLNLPT
jgi:hypothetical protein